MKRYMAWMLSLLFYISLLPWNMAGAEYFNVNANNLVVKGSPYVDVRAYGAVGDWNGTTGTNNTAAFQAAIDNVAALGGGFVLVPVGNYYLASTVRTSDYVSIVGVGSTSRLFALSDCFSWKTAAGPGHTQTSYAQFSHLEIRGVTGSSGYAFLVEQYQNATMTTVKNVITHFIGFMHAVDGAQVTGLRVEDCWFQAPTTGAGYHLYFENNVESNLLSFVNTWFHEGTLGSMKFGNMATGYSTFTNCVFESNYGQYTIEASNIQANFTGCYFGSNARNAGGDPVITTGANIYGMNGGQSFMKVSGSVFGPPSTDAVDFRAILQSGAVIGRIEIETSYFDMASNYQVIFEAGGGRATGASIHDCYIVNATQDTVIGPDVKRYNNWGDTAFKGFYPKGMVATGYTTNNTPLRIWGGTYNGPYNNYPNTNSTVIYEARVVGRNLDNSIYYAGILRSVMNIKTNVDNTYNITEAGTMNETPVTLGTYGTVAWAITNNDTGNAGVYLGVTGPAADNVQWIAEISATGATFVP